MKEGNVIFLKSPAFAVCLIRLNQSLIKDQQAFPLADPIWRSGTFRGANAAAVGGQSRKGFISQCSIAYEETRETHYWLRLLRNTDYPDISQSKSLAVDCEELLKTATVIIRADYKRGHLIFKYSCISERTRKERHTERSEASRVL